MLRSTHFRRFTNNDNCCAARASNDIVSQYIATGGRYDLCCHYTNRNSHTGFRLVPVWMTLNGVERPQCANLTKYRFIQRSLYITERRFTYYQQQKDSPRPIDFSEVQAVHKFAPSSDENGFSLSLAS